TQKETADDLKFTPKPGEGAAAAIVNWTSFYAALANLQKAENDSMVKADQQFYKNQEAIAKQAYDAGVGDYLDYWDQVNALQDAQLAIKQQAIESDLKVQQDAYAAASQAYTGAVQKTIANDEAKHKSNEQIIADVEKLAETTGTKLMGILTQ